MKDKKGQAPGLNQLVPIVLILVTVGLVIGAGALILEKFADKVQTTTDTIVSNFSISLNNPLNQTSSWYIPEKATSPGRFVSLSTTIRLINGTAGDYWLVLAGNYSVYSNGSIILTSIASYDNLTMANITYTYTLNDNPPEYQATTNATKGIAELASFLPTIGIIIAAVVIIALIVGAFAGAAGRRR